MSHSFVGLIMLIGIVKKNAIMQIDFALEAERHRRMTPAQAIREGCLIRFRPIMMTTMAALLVRCRSPLATAPVERRDGRSVLLSSADCWCHSSSRSTSRQSSTPTWPVW